MTIVITRAAGLVTLQDLGRHGHMHEAVPPGGALVPELLIAANRAAHNDDDALALEIMGSVTIQAQHPVTIADRDGSHLLRTGEEHTHASGATRAAYLAVRGGFAGRRGTLVCAQLGARLGKGAELELARAPETLAPPVAALAAPSSTAPIRIVPGPDLDAFDAHAITTLTAATYTIAPTSDRVGTRLVGPALPRRAGYRERSNPMVRGAIEVPADGAPIVLGPEHPTTGGYPILAVISHADLGRFFATPLGGSIRFIA